MIRGRLLAAGAVAAFVLGLLATAAPGLLALGITDLLVVGAAVAALVQAIRVGTARVRRDEEWATTPDPELPPTVAPPGADFQDALEAFVDERHVYQGGTRVRSELRAAAVAVLSRYGDLSAADARERVEAGTWTDDPYAAAFVLDEAPPEPAALSRARSLLGGESSYRRGLGRAVDAVVAAADLPPPPGGDPAGNADADANLLDRLRDRFGDAPRRRREEDRPTALDRAEPGRLHPDAFEGVGDGNDAAGGGPDGGEGDASERAADPDSDPVATPDGGESAVATERWYGVGAIALLAVGAGVLAREPGALLAGVVAIAAAAYARAGSTPAPTLAVERTVAEETPDPGERVAVTLTVENAGDRTLPDCRLLDGVPEALPVVEGSPRLGTALRPGETATVEYEVAARRGVHRFERPLAVARDLPEGVEVVGRAGEDPTAIRCTPPLEPLDVPVPLRAATAGYTGPVATDVGGEGVEFHATREYRPGDPMNRIDWNRHARTGELATLEFREEQSATVVVAVDAREPAYVGPEPYGEHAVERAATAAGRVAATLIDAGNRAGLAALGDADCWLEPGRGRTHRTRARRLLRTAPPRSPADVSARNWRRRLFRRLPAGSQVVLVSPLVDDGAADVARALEARGHPVTVLSPDPTVTEGAGPRLARVARTVRTTDLREHGIPVVDWNWAEPVDVALARFAGRGSG